MFRHRRRITARVLPGLLVAGLGVLLVLNNLDVYELGGLERYWPLLLVAFGIHRVLTRQAAAAAWARSFLWR